MMEVATETGFDLASAVARLREMPPFLEGALARMEPGAVMRRPSPQAFSLGEHACHLRDLEREGYLARVRRLLAEEAPALQGFDGDAVAAASDYPSQDARAAAREFAATRGELLALLAPLTASQLLRPATFEGEPVTFARVVAMIVEHDREHRDEIGRLPWK